MHAICAHKDTRTTRNHEGDRLESKLISYKRRTITYCTCLLNQFEMLLTLETSLKRLFQALEERMGKTFSEITLLCTVSLWMPVID